jgi:ribonuclease HI
MTKIKIYSDGASRGNPGLAGCGYAVYADDQEISTGKKFLGTTTNNVAEYTAVVEAAKDPVLNQFAEVDFYLDSELVVKQMKGEYKVRNEKLIPLKNELERLLQGKKVTFNHIPRNLNKTADKLANQAIDERVR